MAKHYKKQRSEYAFKSVEIFDRNKLQQIADEEGLEIDWTKWDKLVDKTKQDITSTLEKNKRNGGRAPIPIYVYKNREFVGKFNSMSETANKIGLTPPTVANLLKRGKTTKEGFYFTKQELTNEEINTLPIKEKSIKDGMKRYDGRSCRKQVEKQSYEVPCSTLKVCHFSKNKEERIRDFKKFLWTKFYDRWMRIPKKVATLERVYIQEFLETI